MSRIVKITHPYAWELLQARIDQANVTGQPLIERPFYYQDKTSGMTFYDLYGCVGWPTEVSDTDMGRPGYLAIVGIVRPKDEGKPVQDAKFLLMAEAEHRDVPSMLEMMLTMRAEYGFGQHPTLLQAWWGDPERFIQTIALRNERLIAEGGENAAILISPPAGFYESRAFDEYVRSLHSVIVPERIRFYFGGNQVLRKRLPEFKRDDPAVMAVGGLVHTLLSHCEWMDQHRESAFTVEKGER